MPGPPKKPLEQRRRTGTHPGRDSGGRKLPDAPKLEPGNLVSLPGCGTDIPPLPDTLLEDGPGADRWRRLWTEAKSWIARSDIDGVVRICELEDLRAGMRSALAEDGYRVKGSQGQMRPNPLIAQLRATDGQLLQLEVQYGLTPASRGAQGVGEVRSETASALDAILQRQAARSRSRKRA